jgi:hypothetical protein
MIELKGNSMAALTWILAKSLTTPSATASLAAIGMTSGLLLMLLTHRHNTCTNTRLTRMQHRLTNMAGEVSALRDEGHDRWSMQRMWASDRQTADILFGPNPQ